MASAKEPGTQTGTALTNFTAMLAVSAIVALLMLALSLWTWTQLPGDIRIPVHWGINGEPARYGGKFEGLMLTPLIFVGMTALFAVIPRIDPRRANIVRSQGAYQAVWWVMLLFFAGLHGLLILNIQDYNVSVGRFVPLGVGIMFLVVGRMMGRIRSNYMFGIRTPWTLTSELSWQKTHLWGGRVFMLLGALLIVTSLFSFTARWLGLFLGGALVTVVGLVIYSYRVWKEDPNASR